MRHYAVSRPGYGVAEHIVAEVVQPLEVDHISDVTYRTRGELEATENGRRMLADWNAGDDEAFDVSKDADGERERRRAASAVQQGSSPGA